MQSAKHVHDSQNDEYIKLEIDTSKPIFSPKDKNEPLHGKLKVSCLTCDYQTTTRRNLTKHQQSVHEQRRYPCELCDYKATQKGHIKQHRQLVHEQSKYRKRINTAPG